MGVIKNAKGMIIGWEADETKEQPAGKVLDNKEFAKEYGPSINGVPADPEPIALPPQFADQKPEVKTKGKRRTKAEMAASKVIQLTETGDGTHQVVTDPLTGMPPDYPNPNPVTDLVISSGLPPERTDTIRNNAATFFANIAKYKAIIDGIEINGVGDKAMMKLAKDTRLVLKNMRLDYEKKVKYGRAEVQAEMAEFTALDKLWLKSLQVAEASIKPLEDTLREKEEFAERAEATAKEELKVQRLAEIRPYLLHDNGADHYNLGDMPEKEFVALVATYKRLKDERDQMEKDKSAKRLEEEQKLQRENERLKKELADKEAQNKLQQEKIAARLVQLPGTTFDGKNAMYGDVNVASVSTLVNMSDVAFSAIAEMHQKKYAADQEGAEEAKVQRRYARLGDMDFLYNEIDFHFHYDGNPIIHYETIANFSDDQFDSWVKQFNDHLAAEKRKVEEAKEEELKIANEKAAKLLYEQRYMQLINMGLEENEGIFTFNGTQMVSADTIKKMTDHGFDSFIIKMVPVIEAEKKHAASQSTDSDKAAVIISILEEFSSKTLSGFEMQSEGGKMIVAGTRQMVDKMLVWIKDKKTQL